MSQLTLKSLEKRVAALEDSLSRLLKPEEKPVHFKDWRKAVGSIQGDELMKEIDEAGRQIREADRQNTES